MLNVIELKEQIISIERCDCSPVGQVINPGFLFRILDQLEILAQEEAGENYPGSVVSLFKYKHWTIIPASKPFLAQHTASRAMSRGEPAFPMQVCLPSWLPGALPPAHIFQDCRNLGMSLQTEPLHPAACFANIWLLCENLPQPEASFLAGMAKAS